MQWKSCLALVAILLLQALAKAQMTNDAAGALRLNGVDSAPPNSVTAVPGTSLTIEVSGNPNKPFVLLFGAGVQVGSQVFAPGIQLDIGPSSSIVAIANGFGSPTTNFFDAFANTGATGTSTLVLPIPFGAALGPVGALQAFVVDFTVPGFVAATAASALELDAPVPDVLVSSEAVAGQTQVSLVEPSAAPVTLPGLSNLSYRDIGLQRFGEMFANDDTPLSNNANLPDSAGGFFRLRPPTASEPRFFGDRFPGPFVRTIHGDVFQVAVNNINQSGFMRVHGAAAEIIGGSLQLALVPGQSAWKPLVNVQDGVLAAVTNGGGLLNDRIFLIRIDGGVFASTGTPVAEVTPVMSDLPTLIHDRSLTIAGGALYFCADTASATEKLFRAELDGAAPAAAVSLPDIAPSVPVERVSPDIRVTADQATMHLKVSDAGGLTTALCRVDLITPSGQTATIVHVPAPPLKLSDFGRAANGRDGRFSISSSKNRIAFACQNGSSEIFSCAGDGSNLIQISDATRFAAGIGNFTDLQVLDDDRVLFWAGTTSQLQDLYVFQVSTGSLTNLTRTNGFTGAVLPIAASPVARINPAGQVRVGDRMLLLKEETPLVGTAAGFPTTNVMGVDLVTLAPYNITGDQIPGPAAVNIATPQSGHLMQISATSDVVWLRAVALGGGVNEDLASFDAGLIGLATFHVGFNTAPANARILTLRPSADGSSCLANQALFGATGGDRLIEAHLGAPFSVRVPDSGAARFVALERFPAGSVRPGFFAVRQNLPQANASRDLLAIDTSSGAIDIIAASLSTTGSVQILGTALP